MLQKYIFWARGQPAPTISPPGRGGAGVVLQEQAGGCGP